MAKNGAAMKAGRGRRWAGLVERKEVWVLSWRGWLLGLGLAALMGAVAIFGIHSFLAADDEWSTQPAPDLVIMEGWVPLGAVAETVRILEAIEGPRVMVSGGVGTDIPGGFRSYAEYGADRLRQGGVQEERIVISEAAERTVNRTYEDAVKVRETLRKIALHPSRVLLVTADVHSRRSRRIYRGVLGPGCEVLVVSVRPSSYDPERWWASSEGFKSVIMESIALTYEWVRPERSEATP